MIMQYTFSSLFTLNYNFKEAKTENENEENDEDPVFNQEGEFIDIQETLKQYLR